MEGENVGTNALRNAEKYYISDKDFQQFLDRHSHVKALVAESNTKVGIYKRSYILPVSFRDSYEFNSWLLVYFYVTLIVTTNTLHLSVPPLLLLSWHMPNKQVIINEYKHKQEDKNG